MKFIVSSSALLRQLQSLSGVLNSNNPLPILDNFLFVIDKNTLTISASDLETTMTTSMPVEAKTSGKIAIPARILLDTLKTFPEQPLTFSFDEKLLNIEISSDYGKYKLTGFDANDFPRLPIAEETSEAIITSGALLHAISKTLFAAGSDELRPIMSGLFCQLSKNGFVMVGTDAHKLVRYTRKGLQSKTEGSFVLPRKPLTLLKNLLANDDSEVKLNFNQSNAFLSFGSFTIICRLIEGRYPNYEAVIPTDNPNKLTLDRITFLNSVRRVSLFSNKSTFQVALKITGSQIHIFAEDLDFANQANERLACQYSGEDMEIGFNAKFLTEMLANLESSEVTIEMSTPNRAGIIIPSKDGADKDADILMLVMPVMVG